MPDSEWTEGGISRRRLLQAGGLTLAGLAGTGLLAACNRTTASPTPTHSGSTAPGKPVKGGQFTLGMISGGAAETINPITGFIALPDAARIPAIFDSLFRLGPDVKTLLPGLAVSAEPNKTATLWTFKLRDGVYWHDGKPFTADDVVHTFQLNAAQTATSNPYFNGLVDFKNIKKIDALTVQIPLSRPFAQFSSLLGVVAGYVVQDGSTIKSISAKPIGTGPFTYVTFTPGSRSVFAANTSYWEEGKPYVEKLIIDSTFTDDTARLNALLSGAINVMPAVPALTAKTQGSSGQFTLLRATAPNSQIFSMNLDTAPFNDVRVRQAMKLLVDRQALIDDALAGYGTPGNDLIGARAEYFDDTLLRHQDISQAKSLLNAAGASGLKFDFPTSDVIPGGVEAVTLFAQQAQAAGVTVNVKVVPASTYYTSASGFGTRPVNLDYVQSAPSLSYAYKTMYEVFNDTNWKTPQDSALQSAFAASDPTSAARYWGEAQAEQFNRGGSLVWANADYLDAVANNVRGLQTTAVNNLNNYRMQDGWIG